MHIPKKWSNLSKPKLLPSSQMDKIMPNIQFRHGHNHTYTCKNFPVLVNTQPRQIGMKSLDKPNQTTTMYSCTKPTISCTQINSYLFTRKQYRINT